MARMLGAYGRPRCPVCRATPGPDCADAGRHRRQVRQRERRLWRRDRDADLMLVRKLYFDPIYQDA